MWGIGLLLAAVAGCGDDVSGKLPLGPVTGCQAMPAFIGRTPLGQPVAIDTQQRGYTGLRLLNPQSGRTWQHPSWDDAGHVGAFVRDRQGNIYVAPTPEVSLKDNPPALQNRIYRIDAQTGEMALWLELPAADPPSPSNPFGTMGLFYDCDTDSLYASSLAGSTPREVKGRVYRLAVADATVQDQLDATDAIGVGVFNGTQGKRLYLGSARSSDVYSVALDARGNFAGDIRQEFALATLPDGNTTSVRKFEFGGRDGQFLMQAKEMEFGFRLLAENNPHKRVYQFRYMAERDRWEFIGTQPE